jgi:hypothetical protein
MGIILVAAVAPAFLGLALPEGLDHIWFRGGPYLHDSACHDFVTSDPLF